MGKSIQYNKEHIYTHTQCGHGNQHCMMTVSFKSSNQLHSNIALRHESESPCNADSHVHILCMRMYVQPLTLNNTLRYYTG